MITKIASDFGVFTAEADEHGLCRLYLPNQNAPAEEGIFPFPLAEELNQYFAGTRRDFGLPLSLVGTPFQLAVWFACRDIPYGETRTYGELAEMAGYSQAAQAVGAAMAANPLPLLVPCHRVLPVRGGIGHYAGGTDLKQALLDLEQKNR